MGDKNENLSQGGNSAEVAEPIFGRRKRKVVTVPVGGGSSDGVESSVVGGAGEAPIFQKKEKKVKAEKVADEPKDKQNQLVQQDRPEQLKQEDKKKGKKSRKKLVIILIVVAVLLIGGGVGGFCLWQYLKLKEPIAVEWGQTYFMYLKDVQEQDAQAEAGLPAEVKDAGVAFYEVEGVEDPVMVLEYQNRGKRYANVYYIENKQVQALVYKQASTVEMLYNIPDEAYGYYVHVEEKTAEKYANIAKQIEQSLDQSKNTISEVAEYEFSDEAAGATAVDAEGKEIAVSEFDQTFVKVEVEMPLVDYRDDLDEERLKMAINEAVGKYRPEEEIVDEVGKQVEEKVAETEEKLAEIQKIEEEQKLDDSNLQAKAGETLKWLAAGYLGGPYGWTEVYDYTDVTGVDAKKQIVMGTVGKDGSIGEEVAEFFEVRKLNGVNSKAEMEAKLKNYVSDAVYEKLSYDGQARLTNILYDYNGGVYYVSGGIGCGTEVDYLHAKVKSSEGGETVVEIPVGNCLGEGVRSGRLTATLVYDQGRYVVKEFEENLYSSVY